MSRQDFEELKAKSEEYKKHEKFKPSYGTSGFRAEGSLLPSTLFRCGVLMALRSIKLGKATGIVVTASHNPAEDNGVKLVESSGYMLDQSWEAYADELANKADSKGVVDCAQEICRQESISQEGDFKGLVFIGHDTRESAKELVEAAEKGVESAGAQVDSRGLLTTPQLHWMVRRHNQDLSCKEADYHDTLAEAFNSLVTDAQALQGDLLVDCANGVGAAKLRELSKKLKGLGLDLRNTGGGVLNGDCGADFVQKGNTGAPTLPTNFSDVSSSNRCASIDGDADRVVFFTAANNRLLLFDGDRIAVLAAVLIQKLLEDFDEKQDVKMGVVQTAYANGSSTKHMREAMKLEVRLAKTGVKHLHDLAESFDIGIYFEANGHGTILFKESLLKTLNQEAEEGKEAAKNLLRVTEMVNQAVGDAISGILLVEAALRTLGWSMQDWADLYQDLPSSMLKVKVPDRTAFTTTDSETKCVTPEGLQQKLEALVARYPSGRSFVRPSGTEDVVRIYAEAETQLQAIELARAVALLVEMEASLGHQ